MLSPSRMLQAATLTAYLPTGLLHLLQRPSQYLLYPEDCPLRHTAVSYQLQGDRLWWFILAWFVAARCKVSQRPAKSPWSWLCLPFAVYQWYLSVFIAIPQPNSGLQLFWWESVPRNVGFHLGFVGSGRREKIESGCRRVIIHSPLWELLPGRGTGSWIFLFCLRLLLPKPLQMLTLTWGRWRKMTGRWGQ